MRRAIGAICVLLGLLGAIPAHAGSVLQVQLVSADKTQASPRSGLGAVEGLLKRNTPYSNFQVLAVRSAALPASTTLDMGRGVIVKCAGAQDRLSIEVLSGGRAMLRSTVSLRDQTPLVLGGFPSGGSKLMVIVTAL
jgi:hypothetical protein